MENITKLDRRNVKSRIALREALLVLMREKSFEDITITRIVQVANLNRGTFYKNYQYKEEILQEIIDEVTTDLVAAFRAPYQQHSTLEMKTLKGSAIKIFDHVFQYADFYTLAVRMNFFGDFQQNICKILKDIHLQDFRHISYNPKVNKEFLVSYRIHATLGVINEWVSEGFKYSAMYMADQLVEILKTGQEEDTYQVMI